MPVLRTCSARRARRSASRRAFSSGEISFLGALFAEALEDGRFSTFFSSLLSSLVSVGLGASGGLDLITICTKRSGISSMSGLRGQSTLRR